MGNVSFRATSKTFPGKVPVHALDNITLEIKDGEFVAETLPGEGVAFAKGKADLPALLRPCVHKPLPSRVVTDQCEKQCRVCRRPWRLP